MNNTILNNIIFNKIQWIEIQKKKQPLNTLQSHVNKNTRNFLHALSSKQSVFILECKKASPSQGIICKNFDIIKIANAYKNYASVISVLTDEKYFHGKFDYLDTVSNTVSQPVLCKDFIISTWQIFFARLHQADAILLMLSILNDTTYQKFTRIAQELNMGILTEVSNEQECQRAIKLKAKIIGINNRNLHDLTVDINRTIQLTKNIPSNTIIISESGIHNYQEIKKLKKYVHGFLIGSALTKEKNLNIAIKRIFFGENKICGLTRNIDAKLSYESGALYGGLIFIPKSLRYIDVKKAYNIILHTEYLHYVGVFCNTPIPEILKITQLLQLSVVQLHGQENNDYIHKLYQQLPKKCSIWKAINMTEKLPIINHHSHIITRYILDNGSGGTGKTFNWSLLQNKTIKLNKSILSGGLTINNCKTAALLGCAGLDFNSGVETIPGIKDHNKLTKIFQILRNH